MMKKRLLTGILMISLALSSVTGCAVFDSKIQDLRGSLAGNEYVASFYSNDGEKFMTMHGQKISLAPNIVNEYTYSDGGWGYSETVSSVVTINIDGHEVESCGSTVIFAEEGLEPDVDFGSQDIDSTAHGLADNTLIAGVVNKYKNMFGKSRIVVIQSQLGNPICAFSGNSVYYEVCEDLPKTTKLSVDGKALYIHRANFQIIDKALLD